LPKLPKLEFPPGRQMNLFNSIEGLTILGAVAAFPVCLMRRWSSVAVGLALIPVAGFVFCVHKMVTLPPEDAASTSALIPFFVALWPTMGAVIVAMPMLAIRVAAQLFLGNNKK
jgi:hypothetical protein